MSLLSRRPQSSNSVRRLARNRRLGGELLEARHLLAADLIVYVAEISADAFAEGTPITMVADAANQTGAVDFSWAVSQGEEAHTGSGPSFSFVPADDGTYTITLTGTDEGGAGATYAFVQPLEIANVAPTITATGAELIGEGATFQLVLSSTDPGTDAITGWTIDWGDGHVIQYPGNPASVDHVYADGPNRFLIVATATDEDGSYTVLLNNVAPMRPDPAFGQGGEVITGFGVAASGSFSEVVRLGNGQLLLGGNVGGNSIALTRIFANGQPDPTFGNGGTTVYDGDAGWTLADMEVDLQGRIYLAGQQGIARLTADGVLDTTFGNAGIADDATDIFAIALDPTGRVGWSTLFGFVGSYSSQGELEFLVDTSSELLVADVAFDAAGRLVAAGTDGVYVRVARFTVDGDYDTSFGGDLGSPGIVTVDSLGFASARQVLVRNDGITVLAIVGFSEAALVKLDAAGALESDFGNGGIALLGANSIVVAAQMIGAANGDYILGGIQLMRVLAGGAVDTSLGDNGRVFVEGLHFVEGIGEDAAGNLFVAGRVDLNGDTPAVARYSSELIHDSSFGNSGDYPGVLVVPAMVDGMDGLTEVVALPDGSVVVAGYRDTEFGTVVIARYLANGSLDEAFGSGGYVEIAEGLGDYPTGLAVDAAGRIIVMARSYSGDDAHYIHRLFADGSPDLSFGGGTGYAAIEGLQADSLALDAQGNIVIAAALTIFNSFDGADIVLIRLLAEATGEFAAGAYDPSFGQGGSIQHTFGLNTEFPYDLAIDAAGRIVVVGKFETNTSSSFEPDFFVARFHSNGSVDGSFGTGGIVNIDLGSYDEAYAVAIDSQGRIVVGGGEGLARLLPDGTLDNTFHDDGRITSSQAYVYDLQIDAEDGVVAAGFGIARYTEAGLLDSTFVHPLGNRLVTSVSLGSDGSIVVAGQTEPLNDMYISRFTLQDAGVEVVNVSPQNVSIGGEQAVDVGAEVLLDASFDDPGLLDTHSLAWQVVTPGGAVLEFTDVASISLLADVPGTYTVTFTVTDSDGAIGTDVIEIIAEAPGEIVRVGDILNVGGGSGNDTFRLVAHQGVLFNNGLSTGISLAGVTEIHIWGGEGDDVIDVRKLDIPAIIYGGGGNDVIKGSSQRDLIFGEAGDDWIDGGDGDDLLVGGLGSDDIDGGKGDDILVADGLGLSLTVEQLFAILENWSSTHAPQSQLVDSVLEELNAEPGDNLNGDQGNDWFLISTGDIVKFKKGDVSTTLG